MATTTNYSWTTPDDTGLVKDGASAIRTLGSSVDTTLKNLNPSTTLGDIEYRSSSANINTRLGIGTTGQVLTVSGGVPAWTTPASGSFIGCMVWKTASQNVSNATNTTITFDSEEYDTDGFHSTSVNNSRITIPSGKSGYYHVQALISYATNSSGERAGSISISDGRLYTNFAGAPSGTVLGSSIYFAVTAYFTAGDYMELRTQQRSGGTLALETQPYSTVFSVAYVGA
jgi:hypothetical protein